jgi:hypothetical protein
MPDKNAIRRARHDREQGKSASTQAGEFVREEIDHIRQGKHGARSAKQAIAIGLSEARRAGVALPSPKKGAATQRTRKKAQTDLASAKERDHQASPKRAQASKQALRREGRTAASPVALSHQAHAAAQARGPGKRSASASKAARTKAKVRPAAATRKQPTKTATHKRAVVAKTPAKKSAATPSRAGVVRTKASTRSAPKAQMKTKAGKAARSKPAKTAKPKLSAAQQKKLAARHLWELVERKKNQAAQQPAWRALENVHGATPPGGAAGEAPAPMLAQVEMHGHRDRGGG